MARTATPTAGTRRVTLREGVARSTLRVDRDRKTIHNVKVLGPISLNGRRYSWACMEDAVRRGVYEGVKVNFNHPRQPTDSRTFQERFGKLENVRFVKGSGLYGNVRYLAEDPYTPKFLEAAEDMPDVVGMSHNADGEERIRNGEPVIERLIKVRHVDIVADAATVRGLNESVQRRSRNVSKQRRARKNTRDARQVRIVEMDDASPLGDPLGMDAGGATGSEDKVVQAFGDMVEAYLQEFREGTIDENALQAKIKSLVSSLGAGEGGGDGNPPADPPVTDDEEEGDEDLDEGGDDDAGDDEEEEDDDEEERNVRESRNGEPPAKIKNHPWVRSMMEQLDEAKAKEAMSQKRATAKRLIAKAELPKEAVSKVFMESLLKAPDKKTMAKLVEDRRKITIDRQPRSRGRGGNGNGSPLTVETLVENCMK